MYALEKLTNLLPKRARPYAKACWPALGTAAAVLIQWIATGEFDRAELVTALTGAVSSLVTLGVPNLRTLSMTDVDGAAVAKSVQREPPTTR